MAVTLTKTAIDAAVARGAKGERVELTDDVESGLRLRAGERVIEVRPDRPARAGRRERVARTALLGEQLLARLLVGLGRRLPARAAAAREQRGSDENGPGKRSPHYAGGWFPVVPSFVTASSRVA